jgi:tetratricopeptide (TPR) repeat protein
VRRASGSPVASPSARLAEAFGLLQRGQVQQATAIAEREVKSANSAEALHLLALCRKAAGDSVAACAAFEAALVRAPRDANLLGNYANLLSRIGRHQQALDLYRRMLSIAPAHADGWTNFGLAQLEIGDSRSAGEALERAVALEPSRSTAWQALAGARRASGDLEGAEAALRKALALNAGNAAAWVNLGVIRRLLGDPTEALACYAKARQAGLSVPEVDDAEASAWLDLGEPSRALEHARRLTANAPAYVAGHAMLAHILWEHGATLTAGEDPCAAFRAAVASQPAHAALRMAFIRFLLDAGATEEALTHIRVLRRQADSASLAAMEADALQVSGHSAQAATLFSEVYESLRSDANLLNLYIRHLLRARDPARAAACALEALERDAINQLSLAYLGLAWRLSGDAREEWLCGYDHLVGEFTLEPPPGFADERAFLQALESTLTPLHTARREPVNQSLRGGSQTSGELFGRRDPAIAALRQAIAAAVSRYVERLPNDPKHPFLRRKSAGLKFAGSWSVRLQSTGRHVNHFHQEGWISSAYYVALPPSMLRADVASTAGCLQFGEPPMELGLAIGPRRILRPQPGRLVLFPSYLWHGTVPFQDDAPRLTVAFDVVPQKQRVP